MSCKKIKCHSSILITKVDGDGDYLLVLKMSEVYFNAPNMKVFDVVLNGDLTVSSDLDIFEKVRQGTMENTRETFSGWPRGGA